MKPPHELAKRLAAQWRRHDLRLLRLTTPTAWPLRLPIGRPSPVQLETALDSVRDHVRDWNRVSIGTVMWDTVSYRGASTPIRVPIYWIISRPSEWIEACAEPAIREQYSRLSGLCDVTPKHFHRIWIAKPHLWQERDEAAVLAAARVAEQLEPDCAQGLPLRALAHAEIDTKFYEQNRSLLIALLDCRFDGAVADLGLEDFLGAAREDDHWVLLVDLDGRQLPFSRQRVRTTELAAIDQLPGTHLIVVENERSLHQLPELAGSLAVLGCGLDLAWLASSALRDKRIAYWGDTDTWGLHMLAQARGHAPHLHPILMDQKTFTDHAPGRAVREPQTAPTSLLSLLTETERSLFSHLASIEKGRLEQEFLPVSLAHDTLKAWQCNAAPSQR